MVLSGPNLRRIFVSIAAAMVVAACAGASKTRRDGLPEHHVSQMPPEVTSSYELFTHKCSHCHGLSRALDSGIDNYTFWETYVDRMRRQPGSGISEADGDKILVFLRYLVDHKELRTRG